MEIGPPITLPVTAAMPATANRGALASGIKNLKKKANIQPKEAPINNAGEKIPPNKFSLIQIIVNTSFVNNKTISDIRFFSSISKDLIVSEPNPKTSGTNKPTKPHIRPAIIGSK